MKTELTHLRSMLLGGVGFYGDPFSRKGGWDSDNEIGKTWSRFTAFLDQNPQRSYSRGKDVLYEVHVYGDETETKGYLEIFIGEEVNTANLPVPLVAKYLPESDYIKITLYGREITGDWWQALDKDVLPAFHAKRSAPYIIQAYGQRFKGMDHVEDSELDAYIPVQIQ